MYPHSPSPRLTSLTGNVLKGASAENNNDLVTMLAMFQLVGSSGVPKTDLYTVEGNLCSNDAKSQHERSTSSYVYLFL